VQLSSDDFKARFAASREKALSKKQSDNSAALVTKPAWTGEKPARKQAKKSSTVDVQQTLPHSIEAEQGILSSILLDCQQQSTRCIAEVASKIKPEFFYVPAHKTIYEQFLDLWHANTPIDLISFTQILRDRNLLDSVGGAGFVAHLFTYVPTAANVIYYVDIVADAFLRREAISLHTRSVRALYGNHEDDAHYLIDRANFRLSRLKEGRNGAHELTAEQLIAMKEQSDPNILVGFRWLVRGGNSLWAGGAGYGKSSLIMQIGIYWSCGLPVFSMNPFRPRKNLIVQAENDDFDMAEQFNGVLAGITTLGDEIDHAKIQDNLRLARVEGVSGIAFLSELELLLITHRPDIVWIDPLFAFAGCDLIDSVAVGKFLREGLFPVFRKYNCCGNVVHHVGKPARAQNANVPVTAIDEQYLSFGSSEIQNAFRAINVLKPPVKGAAGIYRLVLSKRGERSGARSPSGELTRDVFLKQSFPNICWVQVDEPDEEDSKGAGDAQPKFTAQDILDQMAIGVGWETAKLRKHLYDELDVKRRTFYRRFKELSDSGKIICQDGKWYKK
jgi:hypothetical protein